MAKSVRATLELASDRDIQAICRKDATEVSSDVRAYTEQNHLSYYVLVNTLLMLIRQFSQFGWIYVREYLITNGLRPWIALCDSAARELVTGGDMPAGPLQTIYYDVLHTTSMSVPMQGTEHIHRNPVATMLLILRYPKRFSPLKADKLLDSSLSGFLALQRDLKVWERHSDYRHILPYLREACSSLLNWDKLCEELEAVDISDIVFTPGVSFDTDSSLLSKLEAVARKVPEYFPMPFGIPMVCHQDHDEPTFWGKHVQSEEHCIRIVAVPKNYKTARVIGPEDAVRQAIARRYFIIMDRFTPVEVDLHDQTINQRAALAGSLNGSLATLDLSSASDRITWTLLGDIMPGRFIELIKRVLPTHFLDPKTKVNRRLTSACTMGNSITFWLESIVFTTISRAARDFVSTLSPDVQFRAGCVYGDDMVVDNALAETTAEFLEACGFVVNTDKSYWSKESGPCYRESCGEEYFGGEKLTTLYFPRFPIEGKIGSMSRRSRRDSYRDTRVSTVTALVDLQHKMFNLCVPAALLLAELLKENDEKMTSSTPDQGLGDIWSYLDAPIKRRAPGVRGKSLDLPEYQLRDAHSTAITKYTPARVDPYKQKLLELYRYQQFLKYGPRYDTPLDQLLGVSSAPVSYDQAAGPGEVSYVWVNT